MTAKKSASRPLEEDIEFSNVTKFRNSLLGAVERVQSNPAKRYVITKHGEPEAVLMSYQTYTLLSKVMDQALEGTVGQSREEAVRAAFSRLRREQQPAASAQAEAAIVEAVPPLATNADLRRRYRDAVNIVRAIREQFDELDYALKKQDEGEQDSGTTLTSEK